MAFLFGVAIVLAFIAACSVVFAVGMSFVYWFLSVGTAPVIWLVMAAAVLVGMITGIKNAIKAAKTVYFPGGKKA